MVVIFSVICDLKFTKSWCGAASWLYLVSNASPQLLTVHSTFRYNDI